MNSLPRRVSDRESSFDLRVAAGWYSSILGTVGGFVVTAVVLVFTVAHAEAQQHPVALAFTAGLLVLGLIGSLLSAFALASISGERVFTANLPAAGMYITAAAIVSVVAIFAAFEVLASIYLPHSKALFAGIAAGAGFAGVILNALTLPDAQLAGPDDPHWLADQWLTSRDKAERWAMFLAVGSAVPIVVGFIIYATHAGIGLGTTGTNIFVAIGIVGVVVAALSGVYRTWHPPDGVEKALRRGEAIAIESATAAYLMTLLIFLP